MSEVAPLPADTDTLLGSIGESDPHAPSAPPPAMDAPGAAMLLPPEQHAHPQQEGVQVYQPATNETPNTNHEHHEQAFLNAPAPPPFDNAPPPPQEDQTHHHPPVGMPPPPETGDDEVEEEEDDDDMNDDTTKRGPETETDHDENGEPMKKKKKLEGPKKKGRKPGSLNKKKPSYTMDRGGPMPSWNDMFFALMAFKAKLGTFNVPAQTKLGKWVTKQRQEFSKLQRKKIDYNQCSELSEERIQVLNSLGFIWDTMLHENGRRWNQRFEELKQWKDEHGHCNVPQSTSLGQWVKIQRENKREADLKAAGKLPQRTKPKPCLAPDRIEKLNSIGFQWRVAAPVTGWDNRYNQLLEYAKTHNGDVNVPQYYPADKAFGRWVMKQRSEYSLRLRGLKSQLTDERVAKLNDIGFSWVAPNFKRKVGVGIAPGSPAANVAMTQPPQGVSKLPPMDKEGLMGDTNGVHDPPVVPQPVPAAAAQPQTHEPPPHPTHDPTPPPQLQPPPPAPELVHHQHHAPPPVPMDPPNDFQALHHDPHQQHHHYAAAPHHAPPPPPDPTHNMHPHHHPQQPPPPPHEAMGEDVVTMEFL